MKEQFEFPVIGLLTSNLGISTISTSGDGGFDSGEGGGED